MGRRPLTVDLVEFKKIVTGMPMHRARLHQREFPYPQIDTHTDSQSIRHLLLVGWRR